MIKKDSYEGDLELACGFITDIIEEAMNRFSLNFNTLSEVLKELGYWKLFDNIEVVCVGAYDGVEPVMQKIEKRLLNR